MISTYINQFVPKTTSTLERFLCINHNHKQSFQILYNSLIIKYKNCKMQFFPAYWQNNNNNYAEKKLRMNRNEISRVIVECFINFIFFKFCEKNISTFKFISSYACYVINAHFSLLNDVFPSDKVFSKSIFKPLEKRIFCS